MDGKRGLRAVQVKEGEGGGLKWGGGGGRGGKGGGTEDRFYKKKIRSCFMLTITLPSTPHN